MCFFEMVSKCCVQISALKVRLQPGICQNPQLLTYCVPDQMIIESLYGFIKPGKDFMIMSGIHDGYLQLLCCVEVKAAVAYLIYKIWNVKHNDLLVCR